MFSKSSLENLSGKGDLESHIPNWAVNENADNKNVANH